MAAVLLGEQVEYSGQPPVLIALLHYANVLGVFKELDTAEEGSTSISFAHYGDTLQAFQRRRCSSLAQAACWERLLLNIYRNSLTSS